VPDGGKSASLALDFDLLSAGADAVCLRNRRPGDWIRPAGMDGRKKLQDVFTDDKLPRDARDAVLLAAAGSEILMICASGRSARKTVNYAVNAGTKKLLLLEYSAFT
jgi:tRNA(Ile)-lysidine synthase